MGNYSILLTIDIHNSSGESVLNKDTANTASYKITAEEAKNFAPVKTLYILGRLLSHVLVKGFEKVQKHQIERGLFREVLPYSYALSFPLGISSPVHLHSNIVVNNSISSGSLLLNPVAEHLNEKF